MNKFLQGFLFELSKTSATSAFPIASASRLDRPIVQHLRGLAWKSNQVAKNITTLKGTHGTLRSPVG